MGDSTDLALHAIDEELTKSSDVSEAGEGSGSSEASSVASAVRTDLLSLHAYLAYTAVFLILQLQPTRTGWLSVVRLSVTRACVCVL